MRPFFANAMRENRAFLRRNHLSAAAFCSLFAFSAALGRAVFSAVWADALILRLFSGAAVQTGIPRIAALVFASFLPPLTLAAAMLLCAGGRKLLIFWTSAILVSGALEGAAFGAAFALFDGGFYLAFAVLLVFALMRLPLLAYLCLSARDMCARGGRLSRRDAARCIVTALAMGSITLLGAWAVCGALTNFRGT